MRKRTDEQADAHRADRELYNLISRAEWYAFKNGGDQRWAAFARLLKAARPHVRLMMHEGDVKETV